MDGFGGIQSLHVMQSKTAFKYGSRPEVFQGIIAFYDKILSKNDGTQGFAAR